MNVDLLIINAEELLTLAGSNNPRTGSQMNDLCIINNGAIAIKDDTIIDVGSTKDLINKYVDAKQIIDASDKVVMPGFVDPHTHPVFMQTRENEFEMRIKGKSYVEISQSGGGIRSSIAGVRNTSEDELYTLAKKRIKKIISNGTTTLEAKSGYGLSTESEIKMLKVIKRLNENLPIDIIPTFLGAHEFPIEYKDDKEKYIEILINEMLPEVKEMDLAEYCDIFTEDHVYNIEQSRRILNRAKELGFKIRMHADEIKPIGGAKLAGEVKAISADHLGAVSDDGIKAMRDNGVIAVLLPGTIFSLGMKSYARARDMIDAGLPVALATDYNPGSCNCDSMQFVITLACLQMKMTPAEAITASTINAAHSLELGNKIGSIEVGKKADILIMDMPSYQYLPYHFGSNNVESVIKNGKILT
ncbi:MAG: imidazolonepropionase [Candidatus Cloacimonetes bacterium]|jgi:imidazolonepropionase|nr:imidazolonepropionase [Candidatus Cloacimonadota bacterium]MBT4333313.1 imidazolonepropionase [Candidatus Cloacimonadota bacterium]